MDNLLRFVLPAQMKHGLYTNEEITKFESDCWQMVTRVARDILYRYPNSEELIKDAIQNTLTALEHHLRNEVEINHPKAYLRSIAVNESVKIAKALNLRSHDIFIDDEDENFEPEDLSLPLSKKIEFKTFYRKLVRGLTPEQREIQLLVELGMTSAEIAETLNLNVNKVYQEKHKIKIKLLPLENYIE